jgi:hypothetical protein
MLRISLTLLVTTTRIGDAGSTAGYMSRDLEKRGTSPRIPVIKKFHTAFQGGMGQATAMTKESCVTGPRPMSDNIVWRLKSNRHFGSIPSAALVDIPWQDKKRMAVFRGVLTGARPKGFFEKEMSEMDRCMSLRRCKLAYNSVNSTIVDARLVARLVAFPKQVVVTDLDEVQVFGNRLSLAEMLQFKAIIMLEGNDVSSGFKWALYSNSVVMAQLPTTSSWAMEDMLEPWVHYIPLNIDLTDVEEKMQWVIDNDKEADMIAKRGSLWIKDLLYHTDAERDEEAVFDEILRRYRAHFVKDDDLLIEDLESA